MGDPKLTIITGPMFAGKTTLLLKEFENTLKENKKAVLFRSSIDDRYSITEVVSHDGVRKAATTLPTGEECMKVLSSAIEQYDAIFIDEGHFWKNTPGFVNTLRNAVSRSKSVYVAMLDYDENGDIYKITKETLEAAGEVRHLKSRCAKCGGVATMTQRVINGVENFDNKFMPGGSDLYQARCENCFIRPPKNPH